MYRWDDELRRQLVKYFINVVCRSSRVAEQASAAQPGPVSGPAIGYIARVSDNLRLKKGKASAISKNTYHSFASMDHRRKASFEAQLHRRTDGTTLYLPFSKNGWYRAAQP